MPSRKNEPPWLILEKMNNGGSKNGTQAYGSKNGPRGSKMQKYYYLWAKFVSNYPFRLIIASVALAFAFCIPFRKVVYYDIFISILYILLLFTG